MTRKQLMATALFLFAAVSAAAKPVVVGSVMSSRAAAVRGATLRPGFTIFSGDTIAVGSGGSAWIALPNDGQVRVSADSQVRLAKSADSIELTIIRGHATASGRVSIINQASLAPAGDKLSEVGKNSPGQNPGYDREDCEVGPHHENSRRGIDSESNDRCHDH
ncbi:MAG: hypothetical protein ACRD4K_15790 [Candidatus Acidiferrales bacterium]